MSRRTSYLVYLFILFVISATTIHVFLNFELLSKMYVERKVDRISLLDHNKDIYPVVTNYELSDWHDYEFMSYEALRRGPGENGTAVFLTDPIEIELDNDLYKIEGLSVVVSDKISVNRSVPDVRNFLCKTKLYLKHLPHVSIIVIFHNEHWSLIMRTLHGIYNRSPHELLDEIILVNDASTKDVLNEPLEKYVKDNFHGKVKVVKLQTRKGLIVARMEGAKVATSEVLVFLDAHIEVNVNWLPPLLEPIALNPKASTTPIIDQFNYLNYEYETSYVNGIRGIFAWDFDYRLSSLKRKDRTVPTDPHPNPVMLGCAFAINRQYFWDLGAYDDELQIWNGENYELSFKLWLCGGELLEAPCSRVAHVFRRHNEYRILDGVDFVARNFKRVAEVWMDDYKYALYQTDPERFAKVDAGDLTKQKAIRMQLNCKPFEYFLKFVAPDIPNMFPLPHLNDIAYGTLRSEALNISYCIGDGLGKLDHCELFTCINPPKMPIKSQYFHYSYDRGIQHDRTKLCFESLAFELQFPDYKFQNNSWNYDLDTQQIIYGNGNYCISANESNHKLLLETCNQTNSNQLWSFGFFNATKVELR
ncbi:unnamed protein product [Diamesa serratosioi]